MKKKYLKLCILILSIPTIYFIYQTNNTHDIIYLPLGDTFFITENKSYHDFITDYLRKNQQLNFSTKNFLYRNQLIRDIYKDIEENKIIQIDGKNMNIRHLLRDASFLTLSVGINDLNQHLHNDANLTLSKRKNIINKIEDELQKTIHQINKYYQGDIYLIGYYDVFINDSIRSLMIQKLNIMLKEFSKINQLIFIDISDLFVKDSPLLKEGDYLLPNERGHQAIFQRIMNEYKKKR